MSTNLALRLSTVSQTLIARNRKLSVKDSSLSKLLVAGLILITVGIISASVFWAWSNLQSTTLHYQISRGEELKKQYMEMNRKLQVEYSNLTSIARLERRAETYEMGSPAQGQVVKVTWQ
jgi:hypothetical protein